MKYFLVVLTAAIIASCNQPAAEQSKSVTVQDYFAPHDSGVQSAGIKMIPIETPVGKFNVWTKTIGNNPRIKVLLLHGGPAMTHEYMECFESFFPREGFEMIEYDQLGSYYSDQPTDSSLWTTDRFVEEVEQVRKALGLSKDNLYLLGNSWGGILAMEYALKYQDNLKGLIICNMMASCPDYGKYNLVLQQQMNNTVVDSIMLLQNKGQTSNPRYEALLEGYYNEHLCRIVPNPDPVQRAFKHANMTIYTMMQGPSEFGISGRLANWDIKDRLKEIKVPTLTVGAKFDTMDPDHMKWMSTQVQNGTYLYCPEGSHLAMWDDQKHFYPGVIKFIKDVDGGTFKKGE
ncbi:alpha/beta fold hydrolase [Panacibacter ginsenosidivorans]|uniref:Alpha/beta fold hydrolase n=1 Tax=Panacibacter ginsenosidivorans TaxID=1813871 RepID=A0A5B8V9C3_9BACT|nr:proline iminopeptidase-family hydrolase [Panacibacter ginsenosidivorans]QEC68077.1 alpha/beta fold hydrolase [Panacibacter ginsenosidivorans]